MSAVVCTLFEKHYHYGVAALTNSLFKNGYKGPVYVGYRGSLPDWCSAAEENLALQWKGARSLKVCDGLEVHFLPLLTDNHLANHKPVFMLDLLNGPANKTQSIAYFDPDIVIKCNWHFFVRWMEHGIALVHEGVHNDKPPTHPVRLDWEKIILKTSRTVNHNLFSYINSGFCGVSRANMDFLHLWIQFTQIGISEYKADPKKLWSFDKTHSFCMLDQDALNIAAMCTDAPISEMGPEAMDFIHGGWTMSHAAGTSKPWKKNFLLSAIQGTPPSLADKMFWTYATDPIANYSSSYINYKRFTISLASFISRFYRRA